MRSATTFCFAPGFGRGNQSGESTRFYAEAHRSETYSVRTLASSRYSMLPSPECVADGGSEAGGIGRAEFVVVMNEVDMSFRSHKQIARHVQAKSAAKVAQKVVAGRVILAIRSTAWRNV